MSQHRVVVTGAGVVSPVGSTKQEFWDALVSGKNGIGKITFFDTHLYDSRIAGEVKNFNPQKFIKPKDAKHMERFVHFAVTAAYGALEDSGLDLSKEDPHRMGVVVGSGIGSLQIVEKAHEILTTKGPNKLSPFMIPILIVNLAPGWISILLGLKGPNTCVATACATGTHAIGDAFRIIQRGDAEVMFAGGTEAAITPLGMGGFCALRALSKRNDDPEHASRPFDKDRDGFVMGEGAGVVVLEELEHAKKRNAQIYAEVIGYGMSADAYHMTAPHPEGEGAAHCIQMALNDAKINPQDLDYINAHGTSTPLNDKAETLAIKRVFKDHAKKLMISSTKSMIGHLLGAAGGVEFVACCLMMKHQTLHPTINYTAPDPDCDLDYIPNQARKVPVKTILSDSLGFGGHNTSIVIRRF